MSCYSNKYDSSMLHANPKAVSGTRTILPELFLKMNRLPTPAERLQYREVLVFRPNINPNITNSGKRPRRRLPASGPHACPHRRGRWPKYCLIKKPTTPEIYKPAYPLLELRILVSEINY